MIPAQAFALKKFQSTHPVRGATTQKDKTLNEIIISIHAPREGCDPGSTSPLNVMYHFNPRTP